MDPARIEKIKAILGREGYKIKDETFRKVYNPDNPRSTAYNVEAPPSYRELIDYLRHP